jgi:hypothetical protein
MTKTKQKRKSEHLPYPVRDHVCWERPLEKGRLYFHAALLDHAGQEAHVNLHINQPHHKQPWCGIVATLKSDLPLELRFMEQLKSAGIDIDFEFLERVTSYDSGYRAELPVDSEWIAKAKSLFGDTARIERVFGGDFKALQVELECAGCQEPLEYLGGYGSFKEVEEKACTPSRAC